MAIAASRILAMNMHAPVPFLTIILDTKYAIARVRLSKRSAKAELFDTSDAMLAADRRYQAMESYCRDTGERFVYVDGDDAEDDVAERVRDAVTPWVT